MFIKFYFLLLLTCKKSLQINFILSLQSYTFALFLHNSILLGSISIAYTNLAKFENYKLIIDIV
jgi:hypothetical protein